jgi:CheY-like chemotaxis protein
MPGGGRLEIDTDNVPVDEHYAAARPMLVAGEYVRLRVSDTGTGMDREALDHAFEPFFTTKPKGEGSGLGLATVYGIVAQAGGHAQIYSEPGLGTTFTALFPATGETVVSKEQAVESQDRAGGETILVVEDEEVMRDVASRVLAENGYVVLNAAGGSDAIDLVGRHDGPIDLLLTDVVMPQMLGKEVAERICAIRPGLRVLYMSGYAQPVLASQGTLEAGVFLVEKPFTEATLLAKIREVLGAPALC